MGSRLHNIVRGVQVGMRACASEWMGVSIGMCMRADVCVHGALQGRVDVQADIHEWMRGCVDVKL